MKVKKLGIGIMNKKDPIISSIWMLVRFYLLIKYFHSYKKVILIKESKLKKKIPLPVLLEIRCQFLLSTTKPYYLY